MTHRYNLDEVQKSKFVPTMYGNRELPPTDQAYLWIRDLRPMQVANLRAMVMSNDPVQIAKAEKDIDEHIKNGTLSLHGFYCNGPDGTEVEITSITSLLEKTSGRLFSELIKFLMWPIEETELKK
jgi:hypothetical protein